MTIRPMIEADIIPCVELGAEMHAESAFRHLDYDKVKCARMGVTAVSHPNWFAAVDDDNGTIRGMIIGKVVDYYFGNDYGAHDVLWYVRREARGTLAGVRLLQAFMRWAKAKPEVKEIRVGINTDIDSGAVGAVLARLGFHSVGSNWVWSN